MRWLVLVLVIAAVPTVVAAPVIGMLGSSPWSAFWFGQRGIAAPVTVTDGGSEVGIPDPLDLGHGHGVSDVFRFQLARTAGWSATDAIIATAISIAEDGSGDPAALSPRNGNGTFDWGLWQINSIHWADCGGQQALAAPLNNARCAHMLWQRSGWLIWCTFPGGCGGPGSPAWPQALARARAASQQPVSPGQA